MRNETINYYNKNAQTFVGNTISADISKNYSPFTKHLKEGAHILDFGCGSGRDTKKFLEQGYVVDAIDGSNELCARASEYCKIPVKHMYFQDLDVLNRYDGIWACSSILKKKGFTVL